MEPKQTQINIIPALPGFVAIERVYGSPPIEPEDVYLAQPVLAWRVETYMRENKEYISFCYPLTLQASDTYVGVKNPDGTVNIFEDRDYSSFEEFQQTFIKENKKQI